MLIYICDDDTRFAAHLAPLVRAFFRDQCEIRIFDSVSSFTAALAGKPDIALLDIEIGQDSGIDLAKQIRRSGAGQTQVIFITGFVEYCTSVYETEHIYFLLKPLKENELNMALKKAVQNLRKSSVFLLIRSTRESFSVSVSDILYIESNTRKLFINMSDGSTYQMSGRWDSLPEHVRNAFVQCHKSFLVNPARIVSIVHPNGSSNRYFRLDNGQDISISQSMWRNCSHEFLNILSRKEGDTP